MAIEVVGSKFKPENSYGQNGYHGPSSTTPGKPEPHYDLVANKPIGASNVQMRTVSAEKYPPAHGMRSRSHEGGVIPANSRPVTKVAPRGKR